MLFFYPYRILPQIPVKFLTLQFRLLIPSLSPSCAPDLPCLLLDRLIVSGYYLSSLVLFLYPLLLLMLKNKKLL